MARVAATCARRGARQAKAAKAGGEPARTGRAGSGAQGRRGRARNEVDASRSASRNPRCGAASRAGAGPLALFKALDALVVVLLFFVEARIVVLVQSWTADGLFPLSLHAAVVSLTPTSVFHGASRSPLAAWGDALAVLAQDLMLVALTWRYSRTPLAVRSALSAGLVALSAAAVAAAARAPQPLQRAARFWPLLALSTAISLAGVVAQVVRNERNTHTRARAAR